jgi:ABC-type lipopolysaccharide export system ATPase subunit
MSGNGNADAVTLEGRGLVKNYGARRVVDEIDVEVQSGE